MWPEPRGDEGERVSRKRLTGTGSDKHAAHKPKLVGAAVAKHANHNTMAPFQQTDGATKCFITRLKRKERRFTFKNRQHAVGLFLVLFSSSNQRINLSLPRTPR